MNSTHSLRHFCPLSSHLPTRGLIYKLPRGSTTRSMKKECHWKRKDIAKKNYRYLLFSYFLFSGISGRLLNCFDWILDIFLNVKSFSISFNSFYNGVGRGGGGVLSCLGLNLLEHSFNGFHLLVLLFIYMFWFVLDLLLWFWFY